MAVTWQCAARRCVRGTRTETAAVTRARPTARRHAESRASRRAARAPASARASRLSSRCRSSTRLFDHVGVHAPMLRRSGRENKWQESHSPLESCHAQGGDRDRAESGDVRALGGVRGVRTRPVGAGRPLVPAPGGGGPSRAEREPGGCRHPHALRAGGAGGRRHRDHPGQSLPRSAAGGGARRAARRLRPGRPAALRVHRRLRPGRHRHPRRQAGHHPLDALRASWPGSSRRYASTPRCSTSMPVGS